MLDSSVKIRNQKDMRKSPIASLMPKLVLFGVRENQLLRKFFFYVPYEVAWYFIMGDYDNFPS